MIDFRKPNRGPTKPGLCKVYSKIKVVALALYLLNHVRKAPPFFVLAWPNNVMVVARQGFMDRGLMPFSTILLRSVQIHMCTWFSHTSTQHNSLSKQLAAFPHRVCPLLKDEWRLKNVNRAGVRNHNPWIDSRRHYRLRYRGSAPDNGIWTLLPKKNTKDSLKGV